MLKPLFFLLFICSFSFSIADENGKKKHEIPLDNGLCLRLGVFIPNEGYGWDDDTYRQIAQANDVDMNAGMFFDIGSYFYLKKTENARFGFGLNVGWIEFGWTSKTFQNNFAIAHLNLNLIKIGPQVTLQLKEKIGIDVYFQARPGYFITGAGKADDLKSAYGFDVNWGAGLNFRYNVFLVGLEYVFGNFNVSKIDNESLIKEESVKLKTDNLRFSIGFKF